MLLQRQLADRAAALGLPATVKAEGAASSERRQWAPLLLDAQGRQVDASGNVISAGLKREAELRVNQQQEEREREERRERRREQRAGRPVKEERDDERSRAYYDPSLPAHHHGREARALQLVPAGTHERKAAMMRMKMLEREIAAAAEKDTDHAQPASAAAAGSKQQQQQGSSEQERQQKFIIPAVYSPVPDVEWWDAALVAATSSSSSPSSSLSPAVPSEVTAFIHHPKPVESLAPQAAPAPQAALLTARERKKLKRRAGMEAQAELQEKIRLGLLPPPPPKMRLSNLMNALVNESVAEPSELERRVRAEIRGRREEHERVNRERQLGKEQRKEKVRRKLKDKVKDSALHVAVYAVRRGLDAGRIRYLLDVNAAQWSLKGVAVIIRQSDGAAGPAAAGAAPEQDSNGASVVVAEGGPKGLRRFQRLLLVRIDWKKELDDAQRRLAEEGGGEASMADVGGHADGEDSDDEEEGGDVARRNRRYCCLQWTGLVAKPAFPVSFGFEVCRSETQARALFAKAGVEQYFDIARAKDFSKEEE